AKSYEVVVKHTKFSNYLQEHGLEELGAATGVGRRRKEGWRELCSYMAAYFAAHQRDRGAESIKIDQAKSDIIKLAREHKVPNLPAPDTIKEQIAKAMGLLETPEFKLRKPQRH